MIQLVISTAVPAVAVALAASARVLNRITRAGASMLHGDPRYYDKTSDPS